VANYEEAARKFAEALQASGLSAEEAAKAIRDLTEKTKNYEKSAKDGARSVKSFSEAFNTYDKSLEKVGQSLSRVYETMKTAFLGGTAAAMVNRLGQFQKGLYDLSRQATATGQTFAMYSKTMEEMGKKTALSREESAKFMKQVQDSTKGIRLMGSEISDLAKVLSDEFGPKLEDIQNSFKTLAEIQQKDITIFSRLKEGMRGPEFGNYLTSMIMGHKLTREQADTLVRVNRQKILGAQAVDEETKKLRQFQDVQQRFHKAFSNMAISLGQPLMEIFIQVLGPLTKLGEKLTGLMEKSKGFSSMVGGAAKVLAWSAIATTIVAAMSALASKLSAAFQLIKSVSGMGANLAPVKVWVMNSLGGGGGPGAVAEHIGKAKPAALPGSAGSMASWGKHGFIEPKAAERAGIFKRAGRGVGRGAGRARGALRSVAGGVESTGRKLLGMAPSAASLALTAGSGAAAAGGGGAAAAAGGAASLLGPIALVVAALTALAAIGYLVMSNFESIGKTLGMSKQAIDSVTTQFESFKAQLFGAGSEIWKSFKEVGKSVMIAMVPLIKMYMTLYATMMPVIVSLVKALTSIFGAFMKLNIIIMKIVLPILQVAFAILGKVLEWAAKIVEEAFMRIGQVLDWITPLFEALGEGIQSFLDWLPTWAGGSGSSKEERAAKEKEVAASKEATSANETAYIKQVAAQMGVKPEEVDRKKLEERALKMTGKTSLEGVAKNDVDGKQSWASKVMSEDIRLGKAGVDPLANKAEAAVGIGKIVAIQSVLAKEVAKMKPADASAYRDRMEKDAAQGKTLGMSKAMKEALKEHTTDATAAQKNFAKASPEMMATLGGPTAQADAQKKAVELSKSGLEWTTMQKEETMALNEIYGSFAGAISEANGMLSENAETMLRINGDAGAYTKQLEQSLELNKLQSDAAKSLAESTKTQMLAEQEAARVKIKVAEESGVLADILAAKNELLAANKGLAQAQNNIVKASGEELKIRMQIIEANKVDIEIRDAEMQLMESQMQLSKAMFAGMGPTLAIQGKMLDTLDKQISSYEEQKKKAEDAMKSMSTTSAQIPDLQKKVLEMDNKIVQSKLKQVELTKALRDQYLEAITSFSQMEGAFSKFVITRESGVGEAMRNFGMQGGLGVGVQGAGATNPLMQWGAGGNVQFQPMQQMMNFFKQYQGAAGYSDVKGMVPFNAGWAEGTPAGSSMLQGFDAGTASKEKMNQMTHTTTQPGGATPKGPPLDGGLGVINETLKAILKAITDQSKVAVSIEPKKGMSLGGLVRMAGGGKLPGYGGGDSIPALLEQGEFVINKDAAKSYAPLLMAINAQKFANGGPVIPKPETALAAAGGGSRVNINVRGDSAAAIKKVVMDELDASLDATMSPTGSHARLYDPTL
jgi:hypothetical protein